MTVDNSEKQFFRDMNVTLFYAIAMNGETITDLDNGLSDYYFADFKEIYVDYYDLARKYLVPEMPELSATGAGDEQTVEVGDSAQFGVFVANTYDPEIELTYKWWKYDWNLREWVVIEGATDSYYTPDTSKVGRYDYAVRVAATNVDSDRWDYDFVYYTLNVNLEPVELSITVPESIDGISFPAVPEVEFTDSTVYPDDSTYDFDFSWVEVKNIGTPDEEEVSVSGLDTFTPDRFVGTRYYKLYVACMRILEVDGKEYYAESYFESPVFTITIGKGVVETFGFEGISEPVVGETPSEDVTSPCVGVSVISATWSDTEIGYNTQYKLIIFVEVDTELLDIDEGLKAAMEGAPVSGKLVSVTVSDVAGHPERKKITYTYRTEKEIFTVSFAAGGGTGEMSSSTVIDGEEFSLPTNGFTAPAKKTFKTWSVGGVEVPAGENIVITSDTVVTAVWVPVQVTVSYSANGGTGAMAAVEVDIDSEYTLPECGFTAPTNMLFKCWSVGGVERQVGDKITVSESLIATAVWEDNIVIATLSAGEGTGEMPMFRVVEGSEITLPACGFTAPVGKQFKAWIVGGEIKAAGEKIIVSSDMVVTAVWEDIPTIVEFDETEVSTGIDVKEVFEQAKDKEKSVEITVNAVKIIFNSDAVNAISQSDDIAFTMNVSDAVTGIGIEGARKVIEISINGFTTGKATVEIPFDEEIAEGMVGKVYFVNGAEKVDMKAAFIGGRAIFETTHFSTYVLAVENEQAIPSGEDETGNANQGGGEPVIQTKVPGGLIAVVIILGVLVLAAGGFLLYWFVFRKKGDGSDDTPDGGVAATADDGEGVKVTKTSRTKTKEGETKQIDTVKTEKIEGDKKIIVTNRVETKTVDKNANVGEPETDTVSRETTEAKPLNDVTENNDNKKEK